MRAILAASVLIAAIGLPADAQERCDCTMLQRSAACEASVQHRDGVVAVSSSSPACSMVLWTADGQPNVSLVKDGLDIFDWFGAGTPDIVVESCEICLDRKLGIGGADPALDTAGIRPETGIDFGTREASPAGAGAVPQAAAPASEGVPQGAPTEQAPGLSSTQQAAIAGAGAGSLGSAAANAGGPCPGGSPAPELIVPAALEYPREMERYALDGTCEVLFDIAETGAAVNIRPSCSHDGFLEEAARAVAVVRFSPPYHCGEPVMRQDVVYPLVFRYAASQRPVPSMAPIPDAPEE